MAQEIINITSGNNDDFNHIVPSGLTNAVLVVCIGTHQGNITAVTYGGNSLTKICEGSSAFDEDGSIWVLLNPTAGTALVAVSMTGGSWFGATAITLQNIKQTTTLTNAANGDSSTTAQINITPPAGNVCIILSTGTEGVYDKIDRPANMVLLNNIQGQSFENHMCGIYFTKTGVDFFPGFDLTSSQRWGIAAACFEEPDSEIQTEISGYKHIEVKGGMSRSESAT